MEIDLVGRGRGGIAWKNIAKTGGAKSSSDLSVFTLWTDCGTNRKKFSGAGTGECIFPRMADVIRAVPAKEKSAAEELKKKTRVCVKFR